MNELKEKSGTFLIDKPYGWTSFDVVNKVRILYKQYFSEKVKVGHAGTLDPLATGLLIVCIGKDTKKIDKYSVLDKEYIATIDISGSTDSFDLETPIHTNFDYSTITVEQIEKVLKEFIGRQKQIPPSFSAKWLNGKRAYKLARQGLTPELKAHEIIIYQLDLINCSLPEFQVKIRCSKGTYIRALARDIGKKLTGGAYLTSLRRTAIGNYTTNDAIKMTIFEEKLKIQKMAENL